MKVRALKTFEGIKDLERDVFPKAGDEWEVSAERADLLLKHNVVELVEDKKENKKKEVEEVVLEPITEVKKEEPVEYLSEPEVKEEKPKKKKTSKK